MNRLTIDLEALHDNIRAVDKWVLNHGASWSLVTKAMCGFPPVLEALVISGVRSMADSRLSNLQAIEDAAVPVETWYLRLPHFPALEKVVRLADVSLNTEFEIIEALNQEAVRQDKIHRIIIMIELGDLREGVLPGSLIPLYERVFELSNIEVLGIGSNLGCLSGAVPNLDQFSQLAMFRELLQLKFKRSLPLISGGTSAVIPMLRDGILPKAINHFRVGESVFLGTDLINGDWLEGANHYTLHIPPNPPAEQFWSIAVYSWDTRTLIDNKQKRAGQSSRQDLVKNSDGSVDLYYGPTAPKGKEKNWVQTIPGQGWWVYLRFYAPTKAYFDKSWSMSDFEKVK